MNFRLSLLLMTFVASPANAQSSWSLYQAKDPVTDLKTASATLQSIDGRDMLKIVCSGAESPVVSIQFLPRGRYLGSTAKSVVLRFDSEAPIASAEWEYVYQGAFNRDEKEVSVIAHKFAENHGIFIRAMNYQDQPVDSRFVGTGGREAVSAVLDACNYAPL